MNPTSSNNPGKGLSRYDGEGEITRDNGRHSGPQCSPISQYEEDDDTVTVPVVG